MKKVLLSVLIILVVLTGCNSKGYETYQNAMDRYGTINEGREKINVYIDLQFNTENLSEEEVQELMIFDRMDMELDLTYNGDQAIAKNYIYFGGMGMESNFYMIDEDMYMEIPMFNYVVKIEEDDNKNVVVIDMESDALSKIRNIWVNVLKDEDVVIGENTILSTNQGNVKASRYMVNVSEEQLKILFDEVLEVIVEELVRFALQNKLLEDRNFNFSIVEMRDFINRIQLKGFKGEVYIDYDGYPIYQSYEIDIAFKDSQSRQISGIKLVFEEELIEYNKSQELVFPDFGALNIKSMDEFVGLEFIQGDFMGQWIFWE
ncbi:hypothetical protein EDC18_10968 [Natranaerovirga pectinivora]|uniref:Uncharacterized protein n=1 Tax=Natranaerovirga pectinivora TaxID=682400 RepID=A0A4R3MGL1_9FIRM|nr:hypothetical protein [Natranaerovirga pectinivora]TCT13105.1 hypothetical protein EDC18_10968 [Natranaerovirga pectinivora]